MGTDSSSAALRDLSPGEHRLNVTVGGQRREFRVRVPARRTARRPVVAFDGVTLFNQEGSMGGINGLDAAAEKHGFVAVYPIPQTRYRNIVAGWNTPGGYLAHRPGYDDVEYVRAVLASLEIERVYAAGFSAGAQFAHLLAGRLGETIAGVISVSGTWLGTEPPPRPGTAALIIHGATDPVLPYGGGSAFWKIRLLAALGNRNVLLSQPSAQARAYATANGYSGAPTIEERSLGGERIWVKQTYNPPGGVPVIEYLIQSTHGGHTYHGRNTGEGTESLLSRRHGRPLPPEVFSPNDLIAELNVER